jgi:branched-chain amino acid transport system ATP-binding protein
VTVGQAILKTERVSKAFGANLAVAGVSLEIEEGTLHTIIGPNGAGKTTLFNLLTKDLAPTSGRIVFAGEDVTHRQSYEISRLGVGRSYQITSVFAGMTVHDNVWVAAYRHAHRGFFDFWSLSGRFTDLARRTEDVLAETGLAGRGAMLARELSYGDQRLLEIAIALATVPRLLLLDEPTSGLSQEETQKVAELIRRLARQYTVVMIEHKVDVVMTISDRITVMNFGEVIAEGSPAEITANERVKKAYFGT